MVEQKTVESQTPEQFVYSLGINGVNGNKNRDFLVNAFDICNEGFSRYYVGLVSDSSEINSLDFFDYTGFEKRKEEELVTVQSDDVDEVTKRVFDYIGVSQVNLFELGQIVDKLEENKGKTDPFGILSWKMSFLKSENGVRGGISRDQFYKKTEGLGWNVVVSACDNLRRGYEVISAGYRFNFATEGEVGELVTDLRHWAQGPFGGWHKGRLGYINEVAGIGKRNGVK